MAAWIKRRGKKGIFHLYYYLGVGKKTSKSLHTTDRRKATEEKRKHESKEKYYLATEDLTFSEGYEKFIEDKKADGNISQSTIDSYKLAKDHFIKAVGDTYLDTYNISTMDSLKKHFRDLELSKKSQSNYSTSLHTIFNYFISKQWTTFNPIVRIKKDKKKIVKAIPEKDIKTMLKHLKDKGMTKQYNFVYLSYLCAFRISECVFTFYEDHDLKNKLHYIRNQKGKRTDTIPMLKDTERFLKSIKAKDKTGRVFEYSSRHSVISFWKTLNKELNFNYNFHQLRKARGTHLANNGAKLLFLTEYMRHRDVATTKDYYIEVEQGKARDDLNKALT